MRLNKHLFLLLNLSKLHRIQHVLELFLDNLMTYHHWIYEDVLSIFEYL